jgi:hypothetical protein
MGNTLDQLGRSVELPALGKALPFDSLPPSIRVVATNGQGVSEGAMGREEHKANGSCLRSGITSQWAKEGISSRPPQSSETLITSAEEKAAGKHNGGQVSGGQHHAPMNGKQRGTASPENQERLLMNEILSLETDVLAANGEEYQQLRHRINFLESKVSNLEHENKKLYERLRLVL